MGLYCALNYSRMCDGCGDCYNRPSEDEFYLEELEDEFDFAEYEEVDEDEA